MSNPSFPVKALAISVLAAWVGYCIVLFPGRRAVSWFEICTDGFSPDWLATDGQDVVGSHWQDASDRGFLDEISGAVTKHLSKWGGGDVLELAAGAGSAPAVWHDRFQKKGLCTRTILTDIQPRAKTWEGLRNDRNKDLFTQDDFAFECGTFSYVASPVDATQAQAALQDLIPKWGAEGKELRMIHLSLHHFDPNHVQQILEDATRSNAAVLVIDHSPNTGGALYNGALALKQMFKILPGILMRNPIKILLAPAFPLFVAGLWHDATVSILRSYSQAELKHMFRSTELGKEYNIKMFRSVSYGEWIGVPSFLRSILPGMDDQVMNFMFATPMTPTPPYNKRQLIPDYPEKNNYTGREPSKVYGVHIPSDTPPMSPGMQVALLLLVGIVSYKTLLDDKPGKRRRKKGTGDSKLVGTPSILAIGTANPPYEWNTENIEVGIDWKRRNIEEQSGEYGLKNASEFLDFMKRVHLISGVQSRWFGDPPADKEKIDAGIRPTGLYAADGNPTVSQRHAYWAEWAPKLAIAAAKEAIESWGGNPKGITHVVFHSCTGFKAPGVELDIIDALNLTGVRRRLGINYMGCFGGFTGMAVAKSFFEADPTSTILVVCAECAFAQLAFGDNKSKTIGNCFFADGASAAVIGAGRPGDWAILEQETKTLGPETRGYMTWEPNDHSYDMYLDKAIGKKFGMHLYWNLKSYLRGVCKESPREIEWCVHPGGRAILDFFCSSKLNLGIDESTLRHSYDVLKEYGNMSSGTIFFVLKKLFEEARENPTQVKDTAGCFGFGPGLTLEIALLRRIGAENDETSPS